MPQLGQTSVIEGGLGLGDGVDQGAVAALVAPSTARIWPRGQPVGEPGVQQGDARPRRALDLRAR